MAETPKTGSSRDPGLIDVDIFQIFRFILISWRFILITTICFVAFTAFGLRSAVPVYKATMVIAPIDSQSPAASASASLATQFLGSLGAGPASSFDTLKYKMTSPGAVREANKDGVLYSWIFGGMWNAKDRTWIPPTGMNQNMTGLFRAFFNRPYWTAPDETLAAEALRGMIVFDFVPRTNLTTISFNYTDRQTAADMLMRMFNAADKLLREEERRRQQASIDHATEVLAQAQGADLRMAMIQVVGDAQRKLMNVNDSVPFSAKIIELPYSSPIPVSPKITLTLLVTVLMTVFITSFLSIAYHLASNEARRRGKRTPNLQDVMTLIKNWIDKAKRLKVRRA